MQNLALLQVKRELDREAKYLSHYRQIMENTTTSRKLVQNTIFQYFFVYEHIYVQYIVS